MYAFVGILVVFKSGYIDHAIRDPQLNKKHYCWTPLSTKSNIKAMKRSVSHNYSSTEHVMDVIQFCGHFSSTTVLAQPASMTGLSSSPKEEVDMRDFLLRFGCTSSTSSTSGPASEWVKTCVSTWTATGGWVRIVLNVPEEISVFLSYN